jgi:hypothetical protein
MGLKPLLPDGVLRTDEAVMVMEVMVSPSVEFSPPGLSEYRLAGVAGLDRCLPPAVQAVRGVTFMRPSSSLVVTVAVQLVVEVLRGATFLTAPLLSRSSCRPLGIITAPNSVDRAWLVCLPPHAALVACCGGGGLEGLVLLATGGSSADGDSETARVWSGNALLPASPVEGVVTAATAGEACSDGDMDTARLLVRVRKLWMPRSSISGVSLNDADVGGRDSFTPPRPALVVAAMRSERCWRCAARAFIAWICLRICTTHAAACWG